MAIKRCPQCDRLPADCECPGDRWIPLRNQKRGGEAPVLIHLGAGGFIDVRVFARPGVAKVLKDEIPTIVAWADRAHRNATPPPTDLLADVAARKDAGETWGELALAVDRRLASYLARIKASELPNGARREFSCLPDGTLWKDSLTLGAARTFIWHDLRQVGFGDDRALKTAEEMIAAVQRGDDPFVKTTKRGPRQNRIVTQTRLKDRMREWRKHST